MDDPGELSTASVPNLRWLHILLALAVFNMAFGLGDRSLWLPDEGRYAEIAREMVETGDWLVPRLDYIRYFEKPPLVYWLTAASLKLLGTSEAVARLPVLLSGLATLLFTYMLGRSMGGSHRGLIACLVLTTTPFFFALSRFLVLDMTLAATVTGGLWTLFECRLCLEDARSDPATIDVEGAQRRAGRWLLGTAILFAMATLAKGPIALVICALSAVGFLPGFPWRQALRLPWFGSAAVFLLVAAPWFVLIHRRHPEFTRFFFIHEHLDRFLKPGHAREGKPWYFLAVLLGGMYPWSSLIPSGLWASARRRAMPDLFLLSWAVLPVIFFSISQSKLPPYILPCAPAYALILARLLDPSARGCTSGQSPVGRGGLITAAFVLVVLPLAALGWWVTRPADSYKDLSRLVVPVASLFAVVAAVGATALYQVMRGRVGAAVRCQAILMIVLLFLTGKGALIYEVEKDCRTLARRILQDRKPGEDVLVYGPLESASAMPYYLGGSVQIGGFFFGELTMAQQAPLESERLLLLDYKAIVARMKPDAPRAWFLTNPSAYKDLSALAGNRLIEIQRHGDLLLFTNH